MDRRAFLTSAGAASTLALTRGFGHKLYAQQSGLDPNLVSAVTYRHTLAINDAWGSGGPTPSDLSSLRSVLINMRNGVVNGGLDVPFMQAAQSVSNIDSTMLPDWNVPLAQIQTIQPNFQMSDLQAAISNVPLDTASLQSSLQALQSNGLVYHLNVAIENITTITASPNYSGGGEQVAGKWGCPQDGLALLAVGTAFAVIFIMAAPEAGVVVLVAGFWGPLATWGGIGATAWGLVHGAVCPAG